MDSTNSLSGDFADLSLGELTRVSPERDCSTEDEQRSFDAKIMKAFSAFRMLNLEPDLHHFYAILHFKTSNW